jgi:hypothetical protein
MLAIHHKEVIKLHSKLDNKIYNFIKILAKIITSWTANLSVLWDDGYDSLYTDINKGCDTCLIENGSFIVKYNKQHDSFRNELTLCQDCIDCLGNEIHIANEEFIYKKMLTSELSEIGDVNSYIFELFLELYREIEI